MPWEKPKRYRDMTDGPNVTGQLILCLPPPPPAHREQGRRQGCSYVQATTDAQTSLQEHRKRQHQFPDAFRVHTRVVHQLHPRPNDCSLLHSARSRVQSKSSDFSKYGLEAPKLLRFALQLLGFPRTVHVSELLVPNTPGAEYSIEYRSWL